MPMKKALTYCPDVREGAVRMVQGAHEPQTVIVSDH